MRHGSHVFYCFLDTVVHWLIDPGIEADFKESEKRRGLEPIQAPQCSSQTMILGDHDPVPANTFVLSHCSARLAQQRIQLPERSSAERAPSGSENIWKKPAKPVSSWGEGCSALTLSDLSQLAGPSICLTRGGEGGVQSKESRHGTKETPPARVPVSK